MTWLPQLHPMPHSSFRAASIISSTSSSLPCSLIYPVTSSLSSIGKSSVTFECFFDFAKLSIEEVFVQRVFDSGRERFDFGKSETRFRRPFPQAVHKLSELPVIPSALCLVQRDVELLFLHFVHVHHRNHYFRVSEVFFNGKSLMSTNDAVCSLVPDDRDN